MEKALYKCTTSLHFTKKVLQSKQKQLKKQGKGNKPKTSVALTDDELKTLYEKGLLQSCVM